MIVSVGRCTNLVSNFQKSPRKRPTAGPLCIMYIKVPALSTFKRRVPACQTPVRVNPASSTYLIRGFVRCHMLPRPSYRSIYRSILFWVSVHAILWVCFTAVIAEWTIFLLGNFLNITIKN